MKKEMLINVLQPEECRIAIVEDGVLEELYVERTSQESYVGNIYKGRIVNIEPSIQAAFVDFGIGRNGFLHVSDVDPAYYKHLLSKADLAEYEADQDREYGGGGGDRRRDRDRDGEGRGGGRRRERAERPPREMTSWLEQPPPLPPADDEEVGFGAGLVGDDLPVAEEVIESHDITAEEVVLTPPPLPPEARARARRESPPPALAEPDTDDPDFGSGIFDDPPPPRPASDAAGVETDAEVEVEAGAEEAEPKARRGRTRKPKAKADEPAADPAADAGDAKAKGRTRRTKKKDDADPGPAADAGDAPPPDDKPRYMGGAERRTTPGDDEPEIRPFFESSGGYDPDAPNDRFAGRPPAGDAGADEEEAGGFTADIEGPDDADDATDGPQGGGDEADEADEADVAAEPEPVPTGRGFNDDFEAPRAERERGRDRGDRGDRGGRGRDRDRDRDRGPRGGGSRDRDRGPRGGGFKMGGPKGGRDRGLPKPPIQEIFKRGQEVIVQVIKEGIGTKGPTLSTYISIAGRYLVLMPSLNRVGVSRKIEDHDARKRLREIMNTLSPPKGVGFIVRTAAIDRDAKELRNDLAYLLRLWQVVVKRVKRVSGPVEIYRESDMITRTIRDIFTNDIDAIWVDEPTAFAHASEFLQIVMPRFASRIRYFDHTEPLFHKYAIEDEIAKIHQKRIEMPLGGSLVIEQTEALVAIDVNSGNFRADNNAEETAYQMNLHAAKEIARQLRLRDLGGVIVNDFIDMRDEKHRRNVENALRDAMRRDRARTKILRISQFGIIEMTRQRIRPSLKRSIYADCAHCRATGFVKTGESMSIDVMRGLQLAAHRSPAISAVEVTVHPDVAHYLLNKRRRDIAALEDKSKLEIRITGQPGVSPEQLMMKCYDQGGNEVRLFQPPAPPRLSGGRGGRGDRDRGERGDRDRRYQRSAE